MTQNNDTKSGFNKWAIGLWAAQSVLAFIYLYAGWMKLSLPVEGLLDLGWGWVSDMPMALIRFIGIVELLGGIGILLPALLRILPRLTPLAALGMTLLQFAAIALHGSRGELSVLPFNLFLLALSVFVIYRRVIRR